MVPCFSSFQDFSHLKGDVMRILTNMIDKNLILFGCSIFRLELISSSKFQRKAFFNYRTRFVLTSVTMIQFVKIRDLITKGSLARISWLSTFKHVATNLTGSSISRIGSCKKVSKHSSKFAFTGFIVK